MSALTVVGFLFTSIVIAAAAVIGFLFGARTGGRIAFEHIGLELTSGTMTLNNGKINIVKDTADTI